MEVFKKSRYFLLFLVCAVGTHALFPGRPRRIDLFAPGPNANIPKFQQRPQRPRVQHHRPRPITQPIIQPQSKPVVSAQAGIIAGSLKPFHTMRKNMEQGYWQKAVGKASYVGSTIYKYGAPLFEPVNWFAGKTMSFLYNRTTTTIVYLLSLFKDFIPGGAGQLAPLLAQDALSNFMIYFPIAPTIERMSNAILSSLIDINNLPADVYERKNEIARRLFARFENHLPGYLQNGKAHELYELGHFAYNTVGHVRCIYKLVDNLTSVVSLTYQLTNHAQATNETRIKGTPDKVFAVIDIIRRCADSYLDVVLHFKLNGPAINPQQANNAAGQQNNLGWFVFLASFFCPINSYIEEYKSLTPFQQKLYLFVKLANGIVPYKEFVTNPPQQQFPQGLDEEMLRQIFMQQMQQMQR